MILGRVLSKWGDTIFIKAIFTMMAKIEDKRKLGIWYSEDDVFDYGVAKHVGGSALLVYFALCRHANSKGKAFPSIKLLMKECDLSNRVVAKSTQVLKRLGLIEIKREKHQYNVYYIKSIKVAITLNNWQKIASDEESLAKKQVTKSHLASDEKSLGLVTKSHLARDEKSHEGLTTEGHTIKGLTTEGRTHTNTGPGKNEKLCKECMFFPLNKIVEISLPNETLSDTSDTLSDQSNRNTTEDPEKFKKTDDRQITHQNSSTHTRAKSKNDPNVVSQSSIDLNVSSLNWPKNLNKAQPVIMALAKLPDDYVRQQVLDVFAKASEKSTVEKPVAYLQKVVQNYLNGDFTPIEKASTQTSAQSTSYPDAQTQTNADRMKSRLNEKETIDQLKHAFHGNRRRQVEKVMAGWDEQTRVSELAEFGKATNHTVRVQYKNQGLDSNLVKSALAKYVADKFLPLDENHFVTWAKKQGHDIESDGTNGYRVNSTKHVGGVLGSALSKMECVGGVWN